jgi:hypothetical protein
LNGPNVPRTPPISVVNNPVEAVTQATIIRMMIDRPPFAANNFLKCLRGLYKWANDTGLTDLDPTDRITRSKPKTEGWSIWTPEQIAAYRAHWNDKHLRRCFEIAMATGLRRSDLVLLCPDHDKGDHFDIVPKKPKSNVLSRLTTNCAAGSITQMAHIYVARTAIPLSQKQLARGSTIRAKRLASPRVCACIRFAKQRRPQTLKMDGQPKS